MWIAVYFDASERERTLCSTDLVVEQGAANIDGQTNRRAVCARLSPTGANGEKLAVDEFVRTNDPNSGQS